MWERVQQIYSIHFLNLASLAEKVDVQMDNVKENLHQLPKNSRFKTDIITFPKTRVNVLRRVCKLQKIFHNGNGPD